MKLAKLTSGLPIQQPGNELDKAALVKLAKLTSGLPIHQPGNELDKVALGVTCQVHFWAVYTAAWK